MRALSEFNCAKFPEFYAATLLHVNCPSSCLARVRVPHEKNGIVGGSLKSAFHGFSLLTPITSDPLKDLSVMMLSYAAFAYVTFASIHSMFVETESV